MIIRDETTLRGEMNLAPFSLMRNKKFGCSGKQVQQGSEVFLICERMIMVISVKDRWYLSY
jgi:hypothetical protein